LRCIDLADDVGGGATRALQVFDLVAPYTPVQIAD